jgi:tight adherence protein C
VTASMIDLTPILIPALSFAAVAAVAIVAGNYLTEQARMRRRLPTARVPIEFSKESGFQTLHGFVARHFDPKRLGIEGAVRDKLRRELIKAGYFRSYAVNYYVLVRLGAVVALPIITYAVVELARPDAPSMLKVVLVSVMALIATLGPDAYLARRQRQLAVRYRQIFPDLLDLLVICIAAGLSLEAAFDRVRGEVFKQSRELGSNLEMMGAEMRAGRSTIEALDSFADRLGLDEAASFNTMLRQSLELGSDIGEALRIFSEDMRDRRLLRAEEAANKLSVKMILPLGLFIFPVVLLVVMLPVVIKLMTVLR